MEEKRFFITIQFRIGGFLLGVTRTKGDIKDKSTTWHVAVGPAIINVRYTTRMGRKHE